MQGFENLSIVKKNEGGVKSVRLPLKAFAIIMIYFLAYSFLPACAVDAFYPPALPSSNLKSTLKHKTPEAQEKIAYQEWVPTQSLYQDEDDLILAVKWKLETKAAVFKRGNTIWVFFNRPGLFKLEHLPVPADNLVTSASQFNEREYSGLRFEVLAGVDIAVEQEENHWKLHFNLAPSAPTVLLPLTPILSKDSRTSVSYPLRESGNGFAFKDPIVGDELFIVPTSQGGVYQTHETPSYAILPSKLGLVVRKVSSTLDFEQSASYLHLIQPGRSTLSSLEDRESNRVLAQPNRFFIFKEVSEDPKDFFDEKRQFLRKIVEAPQHEAPRFYLELARHYLSHGFAEEAFGVLKRLEERGPCDVSFQEIKALEGVAQGLMGRTREAILTFEKSNIVHDPEARLWMSVFHAINRNYQAGYEGIVSSLRYLNRYPPALRNFIDFQAAHAAHMTGNPGRIFLDLIDSSRLTQREKELFDVYKAFFLKKDKKYEEAEVLLRKSLRAQNERARMEATLALVNMESLDESGKKAEIKNLENIRLSWRGDETELKILRRLIDLYDGFQDDAKTLDLLRQIITYFPNTLEKRQALRKAESIVVKHLRQQDLTPLKTVAFYKEFYDLFPKDDSRFKSVGKVVDAYFDLNLLEEAGRILREELSTPPQDPEDHARFLLRLGYIFIQTHKLPLAQKALERIDRLRLSNGEISRQCRFLQAKILTAQERPDQALRLLQADSSLESLELQAEISWLLKDWKKVIEILQKMISLKEKEQKLTPDVILSLAVAHFHDKDTEALRKLQERYGSFMMRSPLSHPFILLTNETKDVSTDRQSFVDQLNQTRIFEDHLKHFREKMTKDLKPA